MGRGGGNGRRRNSGGRRGNNSTTQASNSIDASPMSPPMDVRLGDTSPNTSPNTPSSAPNTSPNTPSSAPNTSPNTPSSADGYHSESSRRVVQGSNTTQHMPARSLHKTFLTPLGTVFDVQGVSGVVTEILMGMFDGNWPTFKKVPKANQDLMWERFQSKFQWNPEHETIVHNNWKGILKQRYRDILRDARQDAIKLAIDNGVNFGDDYSVLKPYHPDWIDEKNWADMIDTYWNTEGWKRKSAKNKVNRATLIEGKMAGHSGGSRSMVHTKQKMESEIGGPVPYLDLFETYFTKTKKFKSSSASSSSDSREFTTPKAEIVAGEYKRLLSEEFGPNSADQPKQIVSTLWEKACGGMKKGTLYGATKDILATADGTLNGFTPYGNSQARPNEEVETLKEELKKQMKEAEEKAEIAERESRELKAKVAEMQERDKERELEMKKIQEQMNNFTKFMQEKAAQSS